jgi:hypothetical protein
VFAVIVSLEATLALFFKLRCRYRFGRSAILYFLEMMMERVKFENVIFEKFQIKIDNRDKKNCVVLAENDSWLNRLVENQRIRLLVCVRVYICVYVCMCVLRVCVFVYIIGVYARRVYFYFFVFEKGPRHS